MGPRGGCHVRAAASVVRIDDVGGRPVLPAAFRPRERPAEWHVTTADAVPVTELVLQGEFDLGVAPELDRCLHHCVDRGADVVVDLAAVPLLDCAYLGVLVRANQRAQAAGRTVSLAAPSPKVRRILAHTAVDGVLPIFADREDALRWSARRQAVGP
jgi:anti-anti-sigma factor